MQLQPPLREYCNLETFNASCPRINDVIIIHRARYGRMKLGRCVTRNLGYVGCEADVLQILDARCSGKRRCEISIPDAHLHATRACPDDTTSYLEVSYSCLQGEFVYSRQRYGLGCLLPTSVGTLLWFFVDECTVNFASWPPIQVQSESALPKRGH